MFVKALCTDPVAGRHRSSPGGSMFLLGISRSLAMGCFLAVGFLPLQQLAAQSPAARSGAAAASNSTAAPRATAKSKGEITFDDLKFDMEIDGAYDPSLLTDEIRQLDGKVVKLRGYILPSTLFRETNIDEFVLVRDNQECCFGPGAALFDCVVVNLIDGVKTDFTTRPVTVTGTFRLKEYKYPDDSGHFAIFNLRGTSVK